MNLILIVTILANLKVLPSLKEILKNSDEEKKVAVLLHLKEKPDYGMIKNLPPEHYVKFLKDFSHNSQKEILNYLKENFSSKIEEIKSFWIFNGFYLKTTKDVILNLAKRDEIEYIIEDFIITIPEIKPEEDAKVIEWNIQRVKADSAWMAGYDGTGMIIGDMSTGVDTSHPALQGKFEGHWFDAINGQPAPYDDGSVGTHSMGIILGGDGFGPFPDDIGVAPGAKFVAVKAFDENGSGYSWAIHAGFQKIAEWKGQGVNIVACSNSWGLNNTISLEFWQDCLNWRNLGIIPVFAIGNNGPYPGTAGTPGNFPTVIGVGATNSGDDITFFSARGPAPNQIPWTDTTYWFREDWNLIKPDISAPGVNIRSSVPGGGYQLWTSTGRAAPHLAGAIAILLQKNPYLNFYQIYWILTENARRVTQGEPYPNNDYGWGILDIYQSLLNIPNNVFIIRKYLIDANNDGIWDPGENAEIKLVLGNTMFDTVYSLNGRLISLNSYVSVLDSLSYFGNLIPGDSVNNFSDPFIAYADTLTPTGTEIQFALILQGNNYYDTLYFSEKVADGLSDYINHDCGNIVLTITKYGAIGFMNSNQNQGSGSIFPKNSENRLLYGSFAIGNQYPYVIDRYYEENFIDDDDWVTLPGGEIHFFEPHTDYPEYAFAKYNDSNGEINKGIEVIQRSWAYSDINGDDFITFEFLLKNKSDSLIRNLHAGIFLDWDIVKSDSNRGGIDTSRNLAYAFYSPFYMGSAILNPKRDINPGNLSIIKNSIYVNPFGGLPDSIELKFLNGIYHIGSVSIPQNISTVVSTGPFDINPRDTMKIAFAIVGGFSLSELKKRVDTAYARYWGGINISENKEIEKTKIIVPTFPEKLIFDKQIKIKIYNISGQRLNIDRIYREKRYFEIKKLPKGIYFLKAEDMKKKIIIVK